MADRQAAYDERTDTQTAEGPPAPTATPARPHDHAQANEPTQANEQSQAARPRPASSAQAPSTATDDGSGTNARLAAIIAEQERIFIERQPESAKLAGDACEALAGGVTSSWQISRPQPVWLSHGSGSKLYDVDGHDYVDMHGGYGVSLADRKSVV